MHRFLLLTVLVAVTGTEVSAQLSGVPLGARVRLFTADAAWKSREMYLLDVRPDTLVFREMRDRAQVFLLRSSVERLDVFRPAARSRSERRNLWAGFGAIGGALIGAGLPTNSLAPSKGQAAVLSAIGGAGLGWWAGFLGASSGNWELAVIGTAPRPPGGAGARR